MFISKDGATLAWILCWYIWSNVTKSLSPTGGTIIKTMTVQWSSPTGRGIDNIVRSCVPCLLPLPFSPHPTWRQRLSPVGKEKKSLCVFLCPSVTEESYLPGTGPASQDTFQWSEGIQGAPWLSQIALVIFLPTTRPFFLKILWAGWFWAVHSCKETVRAF